MPSEIPRGDVQSVHRALDLLESIGDRGEAGVSELAREAGLAVSTVHNLLRTLTHRGYLVTAEGRYRLGPGAAVLAGRFDPARALPELLRPACREIGERTGLAVTATVLLGDDAHVLLAEPAPGEVAVRAAPRRGHPLDLATGRLLVALTRRDRWDTLIAAGGDAEPDWSAQRWHEHLTTAAATGTCVREARDPRAEAGVAVPVRGPGGAPVCAVGCSAPGYFVTPELVDAALAALTDVTAGVSERLGAPPPS